MSSAGPRSHAASLSSPSSPSPQASFTALINLAGRQRMLCQRIGLILLWVSRQDVVEPDDDHLVILRQAIDAFEGSHALIITGRTATDQAPLPLPMLTTYMASAPAPGAATVDATLKTFIAEAQRLCGTLIQAQRPGNGAIHTLAQDIIGTVLDCVAGITGRLESDLTAIESQRQVEIVRDRQQVMKAAERIAVAANVARMISFNARISAARAGEYGKEFTALTDEIKSISDDIQTASKDILDYMRSHVGA